jgi:hypothetical protein
MKQFLHIIYFKILTFLKLNKISSIYDFLKSFGTTLVYIFFAIGAFYFTKEVINYLLVKIRLGSFLLHEFASMVFFIFFISVNVGNIIVCYSTLYKSAEVSFLFSKPIHSTRLFVIKFLDNFFYSSSTLLVVLFSVIAGYASYFHLGTLTIIKIVLFNFLPFMFSAASLGVIILMTVIKLTSRFGIKNIITGLVICYLLSLFFFFKTVSPVSLVNDVFKHYPYVDQYFGNLIPPYIKLLPNNWLSESLYWIVENQYSKALPGFIYQITLSAGLFLTAVWLGDKWYYKTWLLMPGLTSKRKKHTRFSSPISFEKRSLFSPQAESLIKKDLLLFLREPGQVIHFLLLLLMILLFMFSVSKISSIGTSNYYLRTIIYLSIFIFNVLFISTLALRFIFPMISLEGQACWKIKTSPLIDKKYIQIKLFILSSVIIFISQMLNFFSNKGYDKEIILFSGILILFVSAAIILMNFGMGCIFSNYNEKNPIRVASSQGASLSFLLSIFYMIFLISVLFIPMNTYFAFYKKLPFSVFSIFIQPLCIVGVISIIICVLSYKFALKALKKDF